MSTKEMGQVANTTTPDPSVCQRPEPPLHQGSFTSAPYCSRNCTCQRRRRRNEQNQAVREWIPERVSYFLKSLRLTGIMACVLIHLQITVAIQIADSSFSELQEFLEMYRFWHLRYSEALNDSGFHSSSDSDKENKP
uniref:Uncharacterized protein n=1 Tax=Setaria digitata TaxID=48799 RepID=A0A915PKZ6_9BILA